MPTPSGTETPTPPPLPTQTQTEPQEKRRRWRVKFAAVLVVAVGMLAVVFVLVLPLGGESGKTEPAPQESPSSAASIQLVPALTETEAKLLQRSTAPGGSVESVVQLGNGVEMEMAWVPPGEFAMGSTDGASDEMPIHKVIIPNGFWMGKYEVTQEQWEAVMGSNPPRSTDDASPVDAVSWYDCQDFVEKLGAKANDAEFWLPTEAEWEYACRAGTNTDYHFGHDPGSLKDYAWYAANSGHRNHPVGLKKPNAWGLHDMHGNVREWCYDWYGDYWDATEIYPLGPDQGYQRVRRGGGWDDEAAYCRSASRGKGSPDARDPDDASGRGNSGFRVVRASTAARR